MSIVEEVGTFLGWRELVIILQELINQVTKWKTKWMDG